MPARISIRRWTPPLAVVAAATLALPGVAGADTEQISSSAAMPRTCFAKPVDGPGVVQRELTATADGLVHARLSGEGEGDWDVAVFDGNDAVVSASSHFAMTELAEGVVAEGQKLTVQLCRRKGDADTVTLSTQFVPLQPASGETIQLVRVSFANDAEQDLLGSLGLDLTEHARPGEQDVLLFGEADERRLRESGLDFEVITADVVAADRAALTAKGSPTDGPQLPSGRTSYRRLFEYSHDLKTLAEKHPEFIKTVTLPHPSLEGRPVEGVEITPDVTARDGKPIFLQMGVHHAREWPSGEHAIEWAFDLANRFSAGEERTVDLLGRTRAIVVPIINPDGFNLSREAKVDVPVGPVGLVNEVIVAPVTGLDPAFAYKRRNCRIQDGAFPVPGQCGQTENRFLGTDPNRNYGGLWGGAGADSDPESDIYRGAGPFSEPETQNVKDFVSARQVTTLITNHTYSDLVLRPPGVAAQGPPPDEEIYKALGDGMAAENGYTSQKSYELYDTTGTTEDWSYFATGGLGFTFEIGKAADGPTGLESLVGVGFHPPYPVGVMAEYNGKTATGGGNREAYFKALEHTADASKHSVATGRGVPGGIVEVEKSFDMQTSAVIGDDGTPGAVQSFANRLTSTIEIGSAGTFEWHMNPSTRPGLDEDRTISSTATTPTQSQQFSSGEVTVSKQIPFTVGADDGRLVKAALDGEDGDDYDLYLYKGSFAEQNEVASSAGADADENIALENAEPGEYVLEVRYFLATGGYRGTIETFGTEPGSEQVIPGVKESWNLTCRRPDGVATQAVKLEVDRGERVDVGDVCARAKGGKGGKADKSKRPAK